MLFHNLTVKLFFSGLLVVATAFAAFSQEKKEDVLGKWKTAQQQKNYQTDKASVTLLNHLSDLYLYNNADSALYFGKQAMLLAQGQKYLTGQAASLNTAGRAYYVLGDYTSSLDVSSKLMDISNKINYRPGKAGAYQLVGLVYLAEDKYQPALAEFQKALDLFVALKDDAKTGKIYFNMGICYDESGQAEKAFYYLNKASFIATRIKDNGLLAMTQNREGETYFHQKNYEKALDFYQKVIAINGVSNWELDFAYSGMAQTYYRLGQYGKAVQNAQKSLSLAKKVNSRFDALRALQILSDSYAATKDYKNAYTYQSQLKRSNDSLFNSEKESEVSYLNLKKQQVDNIRLKNEIKAKEESITFSKRLLFFRNLIAAGVITFLVIIVLSNRQKTSLNKQLQAQKEEILRQKETLHQLNHTKDQLFSIISHDLRSPFTAVLQTLDLMRSDELSAKEQHTLLDGFYQQVNLVTLMVNNLLIWANSQRQGIKAEMVDINVTDTVSGIVSVSAFLANNKQINIEHQLDTDKFAYADTDHVKIIIQNLIGNAIKFTPNKGMVTIFYSDDETYQAIHVKDTGIGVAPEKMEKLFKVSGKEISGYGTNNEAGAGIGLALIKQFVDANNGKIDVKSTPGVGSEFVVYLRKG